MNEETNQGTTKGVAIERKLLKIYPYSTANEKVETTTLY